MKTRIHLYVSRKNALTWMMAFCMVASAVTRIAFPGLKGSGDSLYVWSQIVLPIVTPLLYASIVLTNGDELFYKTAIPVWMMILYAGIWINQNVASRMMVFLLWVVSIQISPLDTEGALLFCCSLYSCSPWVSCSTFIESD